MNRRWSASVTLIMALTFISLLGACQKNGHSQPIVLEVKSEPIAGPSAAAARLADLKNLHSAAISHQNVPTEVGQSQFAAEAAVAGEVTLVRAEILDRVFLYGCDLQYSSLGDPKFSLFQQAIAQPHLPARFQILGDRLQLVADQTHLFNSNINHPARLIHEFPIVRHDQATLTIAIRQASPLLVTMLGEANSPAARTSWVRSVNFVPNGNYLLLETSVELQNGTIGEFMESLFPRDTLVPSDAKPLLADPDREPLAERFRFLSNSALYLDLKEGRAATAVANRFRVTSNGVVEWYATANTPSEYLPMLKAGVEGWNRYSQKMWGRDFVAFRGILPADVKIGDPRYNVINWDSVPDATAAYESQAADPLTGIQSHSLIYLPYAWVKIGLEYWKSHGPTQAGRSTEQVTEQLRESLSSMSFAGMPSKLNCFHDLEMIASLAARRSPEVFAKELLKQVLFHEVGHAMGLDHNFKGSLSYHPDTKGSPFSDSIMDYNQYQIEDSAFDSLEASTGPLLEYDRQIISALYNEARDIAATDPVLPVCNDAETDDQDGGVDPLCIRYDAGNDPSEQLERTVALIRQPDASLGRSKSWSKSLADLPAEIDTKEKVEARIKALVEQTLGVSRFYLSSGAQSASTSLRLNLRALYDFKLMPLPQGIDSRLLRQRVSNSLVYLSTLSTLDEAPKMAVSTLMSTAEAWLKTTPWYTQLSQTEAEIALKAALKPVVDLPTDIETKLFSVTRTNALKTLVRVPTLPFFYGSVATSSGGTSAADAIADYESLALELLETALTQPLPSGRMRPTVEVVATAGVERIEVAKALMTFKSIAEGKATIERASSKLQSELRAAKSGAEREALRRVIAVLQAT